MDIGKRYVYCLPRNTSQTAQLTNNRKKAPLWPPFKSQYENISSNDDLPLENTSASRNLLPSAGYTPSPALNSSTFNTPYVPQSPPEPPQTQDAVSRWFGYGWRGGARIAFYSTLAVLIVNIVIIIWMETYPKMDGMPIIYRGTCEDAEFKNSAIHFAVNALSTAVLAASNYCMQLLSSPNRNHIDQAHSRGHWLDIGISSLRNLRFLNTKRRVLWILLAISSLPFHLVYNSTFYAAIATNNYNILYATDDFAKGGPYDKAKFPDSPAQNISSFQANAANWKVLDNPECIQQYGHDFITLYRNVILVVANVTSEESLLNVTINDLPPNGQLGPTYDAFAWICQDSQTENKTDVHVTNSAGFTPCSAIVPRLEKLAGTWWKTGGYHIDHCLAEKIQPDCHLHFSPHLMGPVIFFNLIKTAVMFYVAFRLLDRPLVTMGDAIESFITRPDPTTEGMCLVSAKHIERHWQHGYTPVPRRYEVERYRWHSVVTKRQWASLFAMFLFAIIILLIGVIFGVRNLVPATLSNAWSLGLGNVRTQNLILGWKLPQLGTYAVLLSAVVANAPQSMFSFLYISYNTCFTAMFVGEDWDRFGAYNTVTKRSTHRNLRVSNPRGNQKSTHFLALPYRYALPLLALSGVLHWLMSQSIFLANISVIPRDGTLPRQDEITTVAYSPQAMVWLIVVLILMLSWIIGNSWRRYGGQMTLVGCNSVAISAGCHVTSSGYGGKVNREEMVLKKLAWGDVRGDAGLNKRATTMSMMTTYKGLGIDQAQDTEYYGSPGLRGEQFEGNEMGSGGGIGHCSFSDGFVWKPVEGKMYA